jgi:hypothetical protein
MGITIGAAGLPSVVTMPAMVPTMHGHTNRPDSQGEQLVHTSNQLDSHGLTWDRIVVATHVVNQIDDQCFELFAMQN